MTRPETPVIEDLAGKAVLVTGSSTGIGAAAARAFGHNRARVAVHYNRSRERAEAVARDIRAGGGEAIVLQGDVRDTARVGALVDDTVAAFGRIDVLINNAGDLLGRQMIAEATDEFVLDLFRVNALSAVAGCRAAVPHMRRQGGGCIINLSSISARNGGSPGVTFYAAAKAYVSSLTRSLAKELAVDNIRVNALSPGVLVTPIHDRHTPAEMMAQIPKSVPMGRTGEDWEGDGALLYLASSRLSAYVTGQVLEVNGGQFMP